jgi:predicted membrane protein
MKNTARLWWGMILILVGGVMLLDRMEVFEFREVFRTWWPLLLVGLGVWSILRRTPLRDAAPEPFPGVAGNVRKVSTTESVAETTLFGSVHVDVCSPDFKGGRVSTIFGACTVDLMGASFGEGDHTLAVDTIVGKVTILVPVLSAVNVSADTVLGSVIVNGRKREGFFPAGEWASDRFATASSRLRIDASAVLGEVVVIPAAR